MSKDLKWQDATGYAREARGTVLPRTWTIYLPDSPLKAITVTRHIDYPFDVWVLICHGLDISKHKLVNKDLAVAQREAFLVIEDKLKRMTADLMAVKGANQTVLGPKTRPTSAELGCAQCGSTFKVPQDFSAWKACPVCKDAWSETTPLGGVWC